jgi:hypothetical protein
VVVGGLNESNERIRRLRCPPELDPARTMKKLDETTTESDLPSTTLRAWAAKFRIEILD